VITALKIKKSGEYFVLTGTWLNKGELHDFDLICKPQDVFTSLENMKKKVGRDE
jgi:hypothetical protein